MLEPREKQVLADIKEVVDALKLPMLITGAGARLLIFDIPYKKSGRTTTDWDCAVYLESWEKFEILRDRMTKGISPRFQATSSVHKFIHINTNIEVDIVPFGEIGQPNEQIQWPDGNEMNLLGLEEALSHAISQTIDNLEFLVVPLFAFIALKLIAWNDRQLAKDIEDINFILQNYSEDDRIYDELIDELSEGKIEFEDAAAFLLGKDIRHKFSDRTITQLDRILSQILEDCDRYFPPLIPRNVEGNQWDSKFDRIFRRWNVLYEGMKAT
ncbi:nucleotidyl transferase AbiEii/AbiGii toxin family protein [Kamptonema animale CS-326]|jgi:predicted nucleotidyltransferase|uniref:nucleotidyl transferase AbiEii/AbiGii toxin family protein n=1 Tax=Kamptonema animale TaxID=92934 RepID=UPI00232F2026|nr:nucleotidyl transferase AbiEii/AbiGii toxin family protein [Kamptonema animale]MDB9513811.1 nucleotidyl transferase AbiEii/AbiGii toxin family protein [Kamptonema animale CS-326]